MSIYLVIDNNYRFVKAFKKAKDAKEYAWSLTESPDHIMLVKEVTLN